MAALVSLSDFRVRYNLDDIEDINTKAFAAIEAATHYLAAYLQTESFDRASYTETFWINPIDDEPLWDRFVRLRLNNGFVYGTPAPTLAISDLYQNLPGSTIETNVWRCDYTKGLVYVSNEDPNISTTYFWRNYADQFYLQVAYTAGFDTSTTSDGLVYKSVPTWLQEAALRFAFNTFNLSSCRGKEAAKACCMGIDVKVLLEPHIRFFPQAADAIEKSG